MTDWRDRDAVESIGKNISSALNKLTNKFHEIANAYAPLYEARTKVHQQAADALVDIAKALTPPPTLLRLQGPLTSAEAERIKETFKKTTRNVIVMSDDVSVTSIDPREKRLPAEWLAETARHVRIKDYDGWQDKSFGEPITYEEFQHRIAMCTVMLPPEETNDDAGSVDTDESR